MRMLLRVDMIVLMTVSSLYNPTCVVADSCIVKSKVINKAIQDIGMGRYNRELFVLCGFGWFADKYVVPLSNIWRVTDFRQPLAPGRRLDASFTPSRVRCFRDSCSLYYNVSLHWAVYGSQFLGYWLRRDGSSISIQLYSLPCRYLRNCGGCCTNMDRCLWSFRCSWSWCWRKSSR
jgi:hypothetical protein